MFQVLILVCSVDLAPSDCQIETALDVIRGPVAANEVMCGLYGQAYIAQTTLAPHGPGEYVKIRCIPLTAAQEALRRRGGADMNDQHSGEQGGPAK